MAKAYNKYRTSRDKNHDVVISVFSARAGGLSKENEFGVRRCHVQGLPVELHDMHQVGGEIPDWMIIIDWLTVFIEIKPERVVKDESRQQMTDEEYYISQLSDGEKSFLDNSNAPQAICWNEDSVWEFVEYCVGVVNRINDENKS